MRTLTRMLHNGLWLVAAALLITNAAAQPPMPPPAVTVDQARFEEVTDTYDFIGLIEPVESVSLRARIVGYLEKELVKEGDDVKKGELLFIIDKEPYEAALKEAQGQLARAKAQLIEADLSLKRSGNLAKRGFASPQDLDTATARRDSAKADLTSAEAAVYRAQLNLKYTEIKAPFAGRIGKSRFSIGDLVSSTSDPLATIVQLDPIRVVYSISEKQLLQDKINTKLSQAEFNHLFTLTLKLQNGQLYSHTGKIEFIDNQIDSRTGTISIRALFANPNNILLPGQFVKVIVRKGKSEKKLTVMQSAVQQDKLGFFVLVVKPDKTVEARRVKTGRQLATRWVIREGLNVGDEVIISGIQKVKPGIKVNAILYKSKN